MDSMLHDKRRPTKESDGCRRFSESLTLRVMSTTDWFDPVPNADTQLFCDAFRIYAEDATAWSGGHEQLLDFFEDAIALVRQAGRNRQHPAFPKARSVLRFPEPAELCLLRPRRNSTFWFRTGLRARPRCHSSRSDSWRRVAPSREENPSCS
jgi:hypothetical protein